MDKTKEAIFHWYVVHVFSMHEKKVKKVIDEKKAQSGLSELIAEVVVPVENVSEIRQGQQRVVEKRIWPGYLLVNMNLTDESWGFIREVPGVLGFLGGEHPTPLTNKEVEEVMRDIATKKETVTQRYQFKVGNHVKIVDGVFANFVGTVTEVNYEKGTISVLVAIFNRETRVDDLKFVQVEEVTEEDGKS